MENNVQEEVNLIQRSQQGDRESFSILFENYYRPLFNYLYHILGERQEAEDITQEAFLRTLERIGQLGPPWDYKSWLYRIASNIAIDHLRREHRYIEVKDMMDEEDNSFPQSVNEQTQNADQNQMVWETLQRLPTNYRQALILREMNGFSYQEVAYALQCSYANVRQLVHRARERFRRSHRMAMVLATGSGHCSVLGELLSAYYDGEVNEKDRIAVENHIATCDDCRELRETMAKTSVLLAGMPLFIPSPLWKAQVLGRIRGESSIPQETLSKKESQSSGLQPTENLSQTDVTGAPPTGRGGGGFSVLWKGDGKWIWISMIGIISLMVVALVFGKLYSSKAVNPSPVSVSPVSIVGVFPTISPTYPPSATSLPSPTWTILPSLTSIPSETPTVTLSPTPLIPTGMTTQNAHCREGPSQAYEIVTSLVKGQNVVIEGRNREGTWWWILLPQSRAHCWVWSGSMETVGNVDDLLIIAPPPLPVATAAQELGCWVFNPNLQQNICVVPCPPNAQPGGSCTP